MAAAHEIWTSPSSPGQTFALVSFNSIVLAFWQFFVCFSISEDPPCTLLSLSVLLRRYFCAFSSKCNCVCFYYFYTCTMYSSFTSGLIFSRENLVLVVPLFLLLFFPQSTSFYVRFSPWKIWGRACRGCVNSLTNSANCSVHLSLERLLADIKIHNL